METGKYEVHNQECHERLRSEMRKSGEGRRRQEEDQRRVVRRTDIVSKAIQKNPGIRKEVAEDNDKIEQIHKRQKGSSSSSSTTLTPPQTTTLTGDVEMGGSPT